jgi:hypothetical protein
MASEGTAVVATYLNVIEAELARATLERAGIHAYVSRDDVGGMHPHLQITAGVRLIVNAADEERALLELDELKASEEVQIPDEVNGVEGDLG